MFHFKLHVMLSLKASLKTLCRKGFQRDVPATKAVAYRLIDVLFKTHHSVVTKQFELWRELSDACQGFSIRDTRKTHVNLGMLNEAQDFQSGNTTRREQRHSQARRTAHSGALLFPCCVCNQR